MNSDLNRSFNKNSNLRVNLKMMLLTMMLLNGIKDAKTNTNQPKIKSQNNISKGVCTMTSRDELTKIP